MRVCDVEEVLFQVFPLQDAEPWDRVGLSVGDPEAPVTGIACALDPTPAAIEQARGAGCNVLVTHHPAFLEAPILVTPEAGTSSLAGETVWRAAAGQVSLIAMHTNLDRSGAARALPARLSGLVGLEPLDPAGYGTVLDAAGLTLDEAAVRLGVGYGALPTVWGDGDRPVSRVGFCSGSLGGIAEEAVATGCDVVAGGELSYHRCLDLQARGVGVILLGHDVSELPYARLLANVLVERVPDAPVVTLPERARWHVCLDDRLAEQG